MNKIAVVTDSNAGMSLEETKALGIHILPMPFTINNQVYFENESLTQEKFYEFLLSDCDIFTSQPSPASILDLWNELLKTYDEIVHIPMSSGLSSSYETAMMLAEDFNGRVQVVNNQRISVTQSQSARDAIALTKIGKSAIEIKEILERTKFDTGIYIMVDTLKYLKKGGRLTPAVALIGTVLNIKPVLQIQGERLDTYSKARNLKHAKKVMIQALKKDILSKYPNAFEEKKFRIMVAHTQNEAEAKEFAQTINQEFAMEVCDIRPLSLSVSCHIGPGALACAWTRNLSELE
ncbi:MAG: DegV family protein [Lachnospiraceae bacterium]